MTIVRFELNAAAEKLFAEIRATDEFLETTPKLFFIKSMRSFMQRRNEAVESRKAAIVAAQPKQPAQKETADERKKREQAEFRERKLEEYRSTGEWPKVRRYEKGSGHKKGSVETHEGHILFTIPGDPARMMCWTPPEDYPHMADYRLALQELAQINADAPPVDPCKPKQEDFDTDEELYEAENLYERTTERDAIDALPDLPSVTVKRVPMLTSTKTLDEEIQELLNVG